MFYPPQHAYFVIFDIVANSKTKGKGFSPLPFVLCVFRHAEAGGNLVKTHGAPPLFHRVQHILDKNSITSGWIIQQNMGHSTHDFAVLQNRRPAHE